MKKEKANELLEEIARDYPDLVGTIARRILEQNSKVVIDILDRLGETEAGVLRFDIRVHKGQVTDMVVSKSDRIIYK
jgi:glycine cleavage system regulatory protein